MAAVSTVETRKFPFITISTWIVIIALWLLFICAAYFVSIGSDFGPADFNVYYQAAQSLRAGESVYHGIDGMYYLYTPLLAQLLIPLSVFPLPTAWLIWFCTNIAIIIICAYLVIPKDQVYLWIVPPLFSPLLEALYTGQVTIFITALIIGAWLCLQKDRRYAAGALLAFAAWIKVYPALLIVYFLFRRDWQVVRGAILTSIVLVLFQIAVSGANEFVASFETLFMLAQNGQPNLIERSSSIQAFSSQWFQENNGVIPVLVHPFAYWLVRITLTVSVLISAFFRRTQNRQLEYALAIIASLLISPTLFVSGMPPLIFAYFLVYQGGNKILRWICALSCGMLLIYYLYEVGYKPMPQSGLVLAFGFYTIITMWVALSLILNPRYHAGSCSCRQLTNRSKS